MGGGGRGGWPKKKILLLLPFQTKQSVYGMHVCSTYPKLSCREEDARTAYGLRRIPYKNICSKTIIHEIPAKKTNLLMTVHHLIEDLISNIPSYPADLIIQKSS